MLVTIFYNTCGAQLCQNLVSKRQFLQAMAICFEIRRKFSCYISLKMGGLATWKTDKRGVLFTGGTKIRRSFPGFSHPVILTF
jgi:hypothetical protein